MAGFIPEITTRVSVNTDTSSIDEAISISQSDLVASELGFAEELEGIKQELLSLEDPLAEAVADALSSNQENIIASKHYVTGMAANGVDVMQDGGDYLVGNTATSVDGFPYPLAIETGRREVFPIDKKVLRWFEGGNFSKPIFARHSSSVDPDPFVEPSIDDTLYQIDTILNEEFNL